MRNEHRRVTGRTCLGEIRIDAACEVEGIPLEQAIRVVEEIVERRILHWAGQKDALIVLPFTRGGEVIH